MTIQEFAKKLDGREDGREITREEEQEAKELGFVVVLGVSDDTVKLCGAIDDDAGCFKGRTILLDKYGIVDDCRSVCRHYLKAIKRAKKIKAIWHDAGEYNWTYETEIPHATFDIFEDREKYCRGIVFDIKSLREAE